MYLAYMHFTPVVCLSLQSVIEGKRLFAAMVVHYVYNRVCSHFLLEVECFQLANDVVGESWS